MVSYLASQQTLDRIKKVHNEIEYERYLSCFVVAHSSSTIVYGESLGLNFRNFISSVVLQFPLQPLHIPQQMIFGGTFCERCRTRDCSLKITC